MTGHGIQTGHGRGNTGQKSRHTQALGWWQGIPPSEPPLPVISDMLLKDLNREETGVANETRDIVPHLVSRCRSKPPGPKLGVGVWGTQAT